MTAIGCLVGLLRCDCGRRGLMSVYLSPTDHHELVGRDVPVVGTAYCERCGRVERTRVHLDGCGEFVFVPESCGRPEQLVLF